MKGAPVPAAGPFRAAAPRNFIDQHTFARMAQAKVEPAALSSDEEFLRRTFLDATGRIPSAADVRAFLYDSGPAKRDQVIAALLASPEYADRWANFLGDLVRETVTSAQFNLQIQGRNAWYDYIRDSLANDRPYTQFVRDTVSATGNNWDVGASNFIHRWRQGNGPIQDTYDNLAAAVGTNFLGLSLECISCHDGAGHTNSINLYLTSKSRKDLWGMAAYFSRITLPAPQRIPDAVRPETNYLKYSVNDASTGDYRLNTRNGNKTPRLPFPGESAIVTPKFILSGEAPRQGEPFRLALARQLTSSAGSRQLARATANYVWKELFGLGIVEPAESFDLLRIASNSSLPDGWTLQATHPELLEALADEFINSNFSFRRLVEVIMQSATYQLSSRYEGEWSDQNIQYFARKFPRRLKAEELHDAVVKATNVPPNPIFQVQFKTETLAWAMQLPDTQEPRNNGTSRAFLDIFLRGNRDTIPRSGESSLIQQLNLLNNTFVTSRVKASAANSTVGRLIKTYTAPTDLVNELYLATLSRRPTAAELTAGIRYLTRGGTVSSRLEDLQFALLNKVDFIFNY